MSHFGVFFVTVWDSVTDIGPRIMFFRSREEVRWSCNSCGRSCCLLAMTATGSWLLQLFAGRSNHAEKSCLAWVALKTGRKCVARTAVPLCLSADHSGNMKQSCLTWVALKMSRNVWPEPAVSLYLSTDVYSHIFAGKPEGNNRPLMKPRRRWKSVLKWILRK
jgi:hypothetical protein